MTRRKSLTIAGSVAEKAGRGGHTWAFLQYIVGFRRLGWDVLFLDRIEPDRGITETGMAAPVQDSWNVRYLARVMHCFGLDGHYALLSKDGRSVAGLSRAQVLKRVAESGALINVNGFLDDHEILPLAQSRVFLDIDPGFSQMWRELGLRDALAGHDVYVTTAENIGKPGCSIPTCGLEWITTRQPIVLDDWPAVGCGEPGGPITTIASWRGSHPPVGYRGTMYGLRSHEFRRFATLPRLTRGRFEAALDIHPAEVKDVRLLSESGWSLVAPRLAAGDPWRYRDYIRQSTAELMISKGMHVLTRSGHVGDRSSCYLASGRPVLAQDTGLADLLPLGEGLLTFTTVEEAAEAAKAIERDYARHARAARRLAEDYFDSSEVLTSLTRQLQLH
jgi:hypothetical protein